MNLKTNSLPSSVLRVIRDKGTELPFTGSLNDNEQAGTYLCRQCGLALFRSTSKFHSGCGWPSFDEEIPGSVERKLDQDGQRMEILCARCKAHLGHVFLGEGFTGKNLRHCVNSLSLDFVNDSAILDTEEAIVAAGCFWGVEYLFKKLAGVLKTEAGYTGGHVIEPSYEQVCAGNTGHFEALRILYDPQNISYEDIIKFFFEIHDPAQKNGQGPDLGNQYLSAIFYYDDYQKNIAEKLKSNLIAGELKVVTRILPVSPFWPAEKYHQNYYTKTGKEPYCHFYTKRF